ncbi:MAG: alkaline phosphatase D family protein [Planctomycetota bacterium]|jgi:alkaline phosphatase D
MKSTVKRKSPSMLALVLFMCVFAVCFAAKDGKEPPGPQDAYIDGSGHAYYGKDQGGWRDIRRHYNARLYGRQGQRQILYVIDGKPEEAIKDCEKWLASHPGDLESMFNITLARCAMKDYSGAAESMTRAVEGGMPFTRFLAGPRDMLKPLRKTKEFRQYAAQYNIQLIHGPMIGSLTDTSAKFWVRTVDEVPVQVVVSKSKDLSSPIKSTIASTRSKVDYTAVVEVKALQPDTIYYYDVMLKGKSVLAPELPSFRTYKKTGSKANIQVIFGGGAKYTPFNERMWDTIGLHNPEALLLLGDNVYIDFPHQFGDFHKYTYYRRQSRPEFRRLTSSIPAYAIWDDHDCAIGDSWMGPYTDKPSWKMSMLEGFKMNWNNPGYGTDKWPACWFKFSIADVDLFLLDGRFYRTNPYGENPSMLGPVQKAWLLSELKKSKATFKVLASPVPWDFYTKGGSLDTWNGFRDERNEIFNFLEENKINGVVLVSADRHRSDARKIERPNGYPFYEFESSRLTNDNFHGLAKGAIFGYNKKPSFGLLSFDTTISDPTVTFQIISIDNEPIHSLTLKKSEISHK